MALPQLLNDRISLIGPLTQTNGMDQPEQEGRGGPERAALWDRLIDELLRIRKLENDWDGQGAEAPEAANVDHAIAWIQQMRRYQQAIPPSQVVPGVQGEVILEWQSPSIYLIAEICQPSRVEWMLTLSGEPAKHWVTDGAIPYFVGTGP